MVTKTPTEVWRGNPPSDLHRPSLVDAARLADETLALVGEVSAGVSGLGVRADGIEADVTNLGADIATLDSRVAEQEAREFVESPIYATTAAGLAATAVSEIFKVRTDDPATVAYYEYLHDTGDVAILTTTVPATAVLVSKADQSELDALYLRAGTQDLFGETVQTSSTYSARLSYGGWLLGQDSDAAIDAVLNRLDIEARVAVTATNLRVRLWSRIFGVAETAPGADASDVMVADLTYTLAELGMASGATYDLSLDIGQIEKPAGTIIGFEFWGDDGAGTKTVTGIGTASGEAVTGGIYSLFYRTDQTTWGLAASLRPLYAVYAVESAVKKDFAVQRLSAKIENSDSRIAALENSPSAVASDIATPRNYGVDGYAGRADYTVANTGGGTWETVVSAPADCYAVRAIFYHGDSTRSVGIAAASIKAIGSVAAMGGTGFTPLTFGGDSGVTLPPTGGTRGVSMCRSDLVYLPSIPRTDGGTVPLFAIRAYVPTEGFKAMGKADGTTDRLNWATHPDRPWVSRYNAGDCVSSEASFVSTTNISHSPVVGLEFHCHSQVLTLMAVGDSQTNGEGGGITYSGASWGFEAAVAKTAAGGAPVGYLNLGSSGSNSASFQLRLDAALSAGILPDMCIMQGFSGNDIGGDDQVTDAIIATASERLVRNLAQITDRGICPILWTAVPYNPASRDLGASDALRRAYNDRLRSVASRGAIVMDFDAAVRSGVIDGDGQMGLDTDYTSDNTHLDDAGIARVSPLVVAALAATDVERAGGLMVV
ncbi:hypothetical protein AQS8620_01292 [Aquimixticola soesokkakensis]|uniref:Uncharacterized protein n=1 Tax=Aquimixticola soesokkakensis TaxID=1519096 RepID=A0A1Y5SAS1_9RHOB|nr:SGNH/GDSL hydrolase family protein [Aquimixticola soesokkakensis]SLN36437.1 hypothetical protein AQS8620_01292 [Aquimixticola soesokkakensis]